MFSRNCDYNDVHGSTQHKYAGIINNGSSYIVGIDLKKMVSEILVSPKFTGLE